jgi:hypothetical protein
VRSLASAARLLANCTRVCDLTGIIRELGFSSNLVPLTSDGINLLGLPPMFTSSQEMGLSERWRSRFTPTNAMH